MSEKEKKKFSETKFGQFLKKAGDVIAKSGGDILEIGATAVTQGPAAAIGKTVQVLRKGSDSGDSEATELLVELERNRQSFLVEMESLEVDKIKSFHSLEATQLQQEDLWTKRARPTRQYFWLLAVIGMMILDYLNISEGNSMVFLDFNNPLLYIMAADFGYYTLMRTKEKLNSAAQ